MKFNLPLLLALPLLWQAAASADEWADIATAVTVTDGYMCVGELYGDGTGTDILCDSINPYVTDNGSVGIGTASPGNSLTVVGDASVTTLNAEQLCDEDGANCTDLSDGISSGVTYFASLTDVSVSSPSSGDVLTWNGSTWESSALGITSCPNGYVILNGSCYKKYTTSVTYNNARNTCIADGALPVSINNSTENDTMINYMDGSQFWIGYGDSVTEGVFEWEDGSGASYTNWASGEPNSYAGGEDCTKINGAGKWGDWSCGTTSYVMCEKVPTEVEIGITSLVSLTDVSASNPTTGEALLWNGSEWQPGSAGVSTITSLTDVSSTVATEGQVLTWDDTDKSWKPVDAASVEFSCPAGFTLIQNAGQTLGCFQNTANSAASCNGAIDACWTNYGGILPPYSIARMVDSNSLITVSVSSMWTGEASYVSGYQCGRYNASSGRPTSDSYSNNDNYHCFIPATGQISMTTIAALSDVSITTPIDGDTLVWSSSNSSWETSSYGGGTPSGAVIAFNLASCPTGWSEYTAARGRFVRGIDSTGTNDPDGIRALGNVQADDWKSFSLESIQNSSGYVHELFMGKNSTYTGSRLFGGYWSNPNSGIRLKWDSSEIRPKNVALLYCEKN